MSYAEETPGSANVRSFEYNEAEYTLTVFFRRRQTAYTYVGVSEEVIEELRAANDKGKFIYDKIIKGDYEFSWRNV
jgi:hypothetical protein